MRIAARSIVPMAAIFVALLSGCEKSEPVPTPESRMKDSAATLARDLPAGRFQLPTAHTPAPDLWITLPEGYTVKNVGRLPNDEFFIIQSDDPSLVSREAVTPGFLRIYVGVMPQTGLDTALRPATRPVVIAGRPLEQKGWAERVPEKRGLYYQREITSSNFFAPLSIELSKTPLHLQLYAAGFDSARVSELAATALTIGFTP